MKDNKKYLRTVDLVAGEFYRFDFPDYYYVFQHSDNRRPRSGIRINSNGQRNQYRPDWIFYSQRETYLPATEQDIADYISSIEAGRYKKGNVTNKKSNKINNSYELY